MLSAWMKHQIVGLNVLMNVLEDCIIPYLWLLFYFDLLSKKVKVQSKALLKMSSFLTPLPGFAG